MRLLKLNLENFQGIQKLELDFKGQNASIYGDNALGKTTIANAISWLLYDKSYSGGKNYSPKTKGPDGEDLHYLEHSAEGVFKLENGSILRLKKVMAEKYTKKRGSNVEDFTGHTVDYFIDGVPSKQKEFDARMAEIAPVDVIKMLTTPDYFPEQISWQDRRKALLEMCGEVSDEDVIASKIELAGLRDYLKKPGSEDQYYTVEEFQKIANSKKTEINRELQNIPSRIDEAKKAIQEVGDIDEAQLQELIQIATDSQMKAEMALKGHENGNKVEIENKILKLENELIMAKTEHIRAYEEENAGIRNEIQEMQTELMSLKKALQLKEIDLDGAKRELKRIETAREKLLADYAAVKERTYETQEFEHEDACPTCGQSLPAEQIEAARQKHAETQQKKLEEFNLAKSKELEAINKKGKAECSVDMVNSKTEQIKQFEMELSELQAKSESVESVMKQKEANLTQIVIFETTDTYQTLKRHIDAIKASMADEIKTEEQTREKLQEEAQTARDRMKELADQKAKLSLKVMQEARMKELAKQEKELAKEYENIQNGIFLCETFIRTKVSMIEESINSRFDKVRFRLFKEQINGGISEDCEVLVPGPNGLTPYSTANNAGRINAAIDIINVFSEYFGLTLPIVVDNAESITRLADSTAQIIRLVVSENDKKLRVELDDNQKLSIA